MAARLGVPEERFLEAWSRAEPQRSTAPLIESARSVCRELGADEAEAEELVRMRREAAAGWIVLRADAEATVAALRDRGHRLCLISVCSEETVEAWAETPLAPYFDATVFSCLVGLRKPDPRIYELACERLAVPPRDCLFVGDGANDELPGAERVGMTAVQLRVPGEPLAPEAQAWPGARVSSLGEVVALA